MTACIREMLNNPEKDVLAVRKAEILSGLFTGAPKMDQLLRRRIQDASTPGEARLGGIAQPASRRTMRGSHWNAEH